MFLSTKSSFQPTPGPCTHCGRHREEVHVELRRVHENLGAGKENTSSLGFMVPCTTRPVSASLEPITRKMPEMGMRYGVLRGREGTISVGLLVSWKTSHSFHRGHAVGHLQHTGIHPTKTCKNQHVLVKEILLTTECDNSILPTKTIHRFNQGQVIRLLQRIVTRPIGKGETGKYATIKCVFQPTLITILPSRLPEKPKIQCFPGDTDTEQVARESGARGKCQIPFRTPRARGKGGS